MGMVVRDRVVRLSNEVVTTLENLDRDIDQAIRVLLQKDIIKIKHEDVVTKQILHERLAAGNREILDAIDSLRYTK